MVWWWLLQYSQKRYSRLNGRGKMVQSLWRTIWHYVLSWVFSVYRSRSTLPLALCPRRLTQMDHTIGLSCLLVSGWKLKGSACRILKDMRVKRDILAAVSQLGCHRLAKSHYWRSQVLSGDPLHIAFLFGFWWWFHLLVLLGLGMKCSHHS